MVWQDLESLHRSWLELLLASNLREAAALVVDANLSLIKDEYTAYGLCIDLPPSARVYIEDDKNLRQTLERTIQFAAEGHFFDPSGDTFNDIKIVFRVKLLDIEDNWRDRIKEMIVNAKDSNQGLISEKAFGRKGKQVYQYNEMKFASQSEIRIAQEFERRGVLFFPLALAVRANTGNLFEDHREVDFLVCQDGTWGILEVSYHPDRFEKDAEKDYWFKRSGILCIQHYTAERCYNQSDVVVDEFLGVLAKHR